MVILGILIEATPGSCPSDRNFFSCRNREILREGLKGEKDQSSELGKTIQILPSIHIERASSTAGKIKAVFILFSVGLTSAE